HSFSEVGGHGPGRGLRGSSWINGFSSGFDPRISVHPRPNSTGATCSSVFGVQRARAEILSQLLSPGARCQPIWSSGNASTGVRGGAKRMDRRTFLESIGRGAASVYLGARSLSAGTGLTERLGVTSDEITADFEAALKFIREFGLRWVEVRNLWNSYVTESSL